MLGYLSLGFSAPRPKFTTCRCITSEFGGIFLNPTQTPKFKDSIAQKTGRLGNRNEYIFSIRDRCLGRLFSKLLCLKFACRQGVKHKPIGVIRRQQIRIKPSRSVYRTVKYRRVPVTKRCRRAMRGCGCTSTERAVGNRKFGSRCAAASRSRDSMSISLPSHRA